MPAPPTPALSFAPEVLLRAQGTGLGMKAAILDVDGVLTDGTLFVGAEGEVLKPFSVLDGHGLKLLRAGGIEPLVISGRDSASLRRRLADLGIDRAVFGCDNKLDAAAHQLGEIGVLWADTAVIGDDWPDLPLLAHAGFAAAPPNAHAEVRAAAHYVTRARGGAGAAREFCDLLLLAAGRYAALLAAHGGSSATLDAR